MLKTIRYAVLVLLLTIVTGLSSQERVRPNVRRSSAFAEVKTRVMKIVRFVINPLSRLSPPVGEPDSISDPANDPEPFVVTST